MTRLRYPLALIVFFFGVTNLAAEETTGWDSACMQISAKAAAKDPNAKVVAANRDFCARAKKVRKFMVGFKNTGFH